MGLYFDYIHVELGLWNWKVYWFFYKKKKTLVLLGMKKFYITENLAFKPSNPEIYKLDFV